MPERRYRRDRHQSGKELSVLPITKGVDDLVFDAASKRLYASCDGDVSVYEQNTPDNYKLLGKVPTGPLARTALLVPQISRYFRCRATTRNHKR